MADDMTEAEDEARSFQGFDNHPHGKILVRLVRAARTLATRLKALEDRVKALEGK